MPAQTQGPRPPSHAAVVRNQTCGSSLNPANNAWSPANALKRTAISNAYSQASNTSSKVPRTSGQMGQINLNGSQYPQTSNPSFPAAPQVLNPSNVPNPSMVGNPQRIPASQAPSRMSTRSQALATQNTVTKLSNRKAKDYRRGDVINLPFHEPNTNPSLTVGDPNLANTAAGYVYSKRRYAVVLWVNLFDVFCVPLYTFKGKGIGPKKEHVKQEYVCLKNNGEKNFYNAGPHPELEAEWGTFHPATAIHITGGFIVECKCDISFAGRLTKNSYDKLYNHWVDLSNTAVKRS